MQAIDVLQDLQANLPVGLVTYDLYLPPASQRSPLVIIAHGFSRSRANLTHWGERLAESGFAVAIPDAATAADPPRSALALRQLIDHIARLHTTIDTERVAAMGHSAGGFQTLLASSGDSPVRVWIGLDPVVTGTYAADDAQHVAASAYILRAESGIWNMRGNIGRIEEALPRLKLSLIVRDAAHLDPEWPTDWLAEMACGKSDDARRQVFVEYALAALRYELLGDIQAQAALQAAASDPRVHSVRHGATDR